MMVSGSYVASDMSSESDSIFNEKHFHLTYGGAKHNPTDNTVNGLGTSFYYYHQLNEEHYAATSTDILRPAERAFVAMQYADESPACVAYSGTDNRTFVMGFPFECIRDAATRASLMSGILHFLLE